MSLTAQDHETLRKLGLTKSYSLDLTAEQNRLVRDGKNAALEQSWVEQKKGEAAELAQATRTERRGRWFAGVMASLRRRAAANRVTLEQQDWSGAEVSGVDGAESEWIICGGVRKHYHALKSGTDAEAADVYLRYMGELPVDFEAEVQQPSRTASSTAGIDRLALLVAGGFGDQVQRQPRSESELPLYTLTQKLASRADLSCNKPTAAEEHAFDEWMRSLASSSVFAVRL